MRSYPFTFLLLAACITEPALDDGEHDAFVADGKADGAIVEGSAEALGVLRVANELTEDELDDVVRLDSRAAHHIVDRRPFTTLAELDAAPYVGRIAFGKLLAFAKANGYVDSAWVVETVPTTQSLIAAAAMPTGEVWAVGLGGDVLRRGAAGWTRISAPFGGDEVRAIWGAADNDVWVVGESMSAHWDGQVFALVPELDMPVQAVWGSSADLSFGAPGPDVFFGGPDGLMHFSGDGWRKVFAEGDVFDLAGFGTTMFLSRGQFVDRWDADSTVLKRYSPSALPHAPYTTIVATGLAEAWFANGDTLVRWGAQGASFDEDVTASWASGSDDVWFVAGDEVLHWTNGELERTPMPLVREIVGVPGGDVWALGDGGMVRRLDR